MKYELEVLYIHSDLFEFVSVGIVLGLRIASDSVEPPDSNEETIMYAVLSLCFSIPGIFEAIQR